jgi:C4-dicarboxylate-specific signal transduction histidine kinase
VKRQVDTLSATPSKRLFLSIIADYDLNRSICELIDNGLDVWVRGGKSTKINIKVSLDKDQKTIRVEDNAGGLKKSDKVHCWTRTNWLVRNRRNNWNIWSWH